jgi:sulfate adenylyltransferase subunit 2
MIEFRDEYPRQIGAELIVHKNQEALDAGANPFAPHAKMLRAC